MGGQAVQGYNRRKVNLQKKKRTETRNQRKVHSLQHGGAAKVLRKHRPSKKKQQKDAKRRRAAALAEQAKMLASGLITKEDIARMEAEQGDDAEDADAESATGTASGDGMDVDAEE